jgi:hypothetical protein
MLRRCCGMILSRRYFSEVARCCRAMRLQDGGMNVAVFELARIFVFISCCPLSIPPKNFAPRCRKNAVRFVTADYADFTHGL